MTLWKPGLAISAIAVGAIFFLKYRERAEHRRLDTVRMPKRLPQDNELDAEIRAFLRDTNVRQMPPRRSASEIRGRRLGGLHGTTKRRKKSRRKSR